jgi:signal peptidase I
MPELMVNSIDLEEVCTDVLSHGCRLRFKAKGWSMLPFIRNGATVTVESVGPRRLRVGDVIMYKAGAGITMHRIVEIRSAAEEHYLLTRGDVFWGPAEMIPDSSVIGQVVKTEIHGEVRSISNPFWRWLGILWIKTSPVGQRLLRALIITSAFLKCMNDESRR